MDIATLISSLDNLPFRYFVYALLLNLVIAIFGALSYKLLFYIQMEDLKFRKSFLILYLAQFLNFFAPLKTGAIFGKPLITKLVGNMPLTKSIFAVAFENFFSISWQIIMLPILLLLIGERVVFDNLILKISIIIIFLIISGIISYKYKWFLPKLINLKRFLPERIKKVAVRFGFNEETIMDFIAKIPSYYSNKLLIAALILLTIVQAVLLPFFLNISLMFFNVKLSYFNIFMIYWISYILGRLSFLPSGLGVKDVTMGGLLIGFGIENVVAIKTVVIYRAITFVPYLLIGGIAFLYYGHKYTYKIFFKKENVTEEKNG